MVKPDMKMIQAKAKEQRSRKRKATGLVVDDNNNNTDRHSQIMLLLELPEINEDFPSLTDLAVVGRKAALATNNNNNADGEE